MGKSKYVIMFFTFGVLVVSAFLFFDSSQDEIEKSEGALQINPGGNAEVDPEVLQAFTNTSNDKLILHDELEALLIDGETFSIYFFSPTCPSCAGTAPSIVEASEEVGIPMRMYDLVEFEQGNEQFGIIDAPTVIVFEAGEELTRFVGHDTEEEYIEWFENNYK
ncbi:hypothetical protein BKP35_11880 [Anaerobacillus arseniciselenatis]|uniref:Thioredoxin domain-containing protein n=1 Tax=Anaerobacillus arseniciselenatis TaxID=85682 RepID=A0A1S2LHC7_9BACI|nr:thioredoxin family protein [Anaerobacillus arseniciselenatis]OIJ11630.1 hypothetical protein BKP35_11880 [Anaerobacillus arseniciselenatis]